MIQTLLQQHERIALDTNFCVYALDGYPRYFELCRTVLRSALNREVQLVVASISEMELLVKPPRENHKQGLRQVQLFFHELPGLVVHNLSRSVLGIAAGMCARENLKSVDAIIAASAIVAGCTIILGNDLQMKKQLKAVPYVCLDD